MKQLLSPAIDDYLFHRKSKSKAPSTLRGEEVVLRRLLRVVGNLYVENITEEHVDKYFKVASEKRSSRSLGVDVSVLRTFFAWAIRTRRAGRAGNPMADREKPKFAPREWRGISIGKIPALLDAAKSPRDRILLALAVYTLGRSIELTKLKLRDLHLDDGWISYTIPKTFKMDQIPITEELDEELRRWLTYYTEQVGLLDPNWFLVPTMTRPRLGGDRKIIPNSQRLNPLRSPTDAHRIAQAALAAVGLPLRDENGKSLGEGMHTLRRSVARGLYEQLREEGDPTPVETVRAILNHATEGETRRYIGLQSDRVQRDKRLKGQLMFPGLRGSNVHQLDVVRELTGA
jgi:integrase